MAIFSSGAFSTEYDANQGWWTSAGVDGGFEQYLAGGASDRAVSGTVINVTSAPYNADPTGVADCTSALASAISDAAAGDVVYFPAGTFKFSTGYVSLNYKDNITIRGAGPNSTIWHTASTSATPLVWAQPGYMDQYAQEVTGTKTKGTATITVADTTGYNTGSLVEVLYENEVDSARIIAGAAPVWSSGGFPWSRRTIVRVQGKTPTTLTIFPPLPADGTNLTIRIGKTFFDSYSEGVGVEDIGFTYDSGGSPLTILSASFAINCWFHNLDFKDFNRNSSNGSCIFLFQSYKCEIKKCKFNAVPGSSSDGAIQTYENSLCVISDNICTGSFGVMVYESGNSCNCVIAYNYVPDGMLSIFHQTHPSLNLIEGNVGNSHQSDGYHGSSSHNTIFRNWISSIILNRFKRNYVIAGNVMGEDGVGSAGGMSYGNPNMGNGYGDGFAGPTGLSTRVGSTDYLQPGYGPNEYVIQPSDIFVGDFWNDWEATATLTNRISDTEGEFTVDGGTWLVGASPTGAAQLYITIYWNNKDSRMLSGTVTSVAGDLVTIQWGSGVLPPEETPIQAYFGAAGWQERDLDVEASTTPVKNYYANGSGTGSIVNNIADTLPDSLVYTDKPDWFGDLPWPPFDPTAPVFDATRIPAAWRAINDNEDYMDITAVSTPAFSPAAGTYGSAQNITITCATGGATIRYTIDGSTPTNSHGTVYSTPVPISENTTLKAIAYDGVLTDSSVRTGAYLFADFVVETPVLSPSTGTYTSVQNVTITCGTSGATIHYTMDGATPTTASSTYSAPISVTTSRTIKAIAVKDGMTDSSIGIASYTIDLPSPPGPINATSMIVSTISMSA